MRYDIAIIGTGPAGISAAINTKLRNKNIIVFGSQEVSTKVSKAPKVNDYLGLPGLDGISLKNQFIEHIKTLNIEVTEEKVSNVYAMGDYFALIADNKPYEATTVILATGVEFTNPLKGEKEFYGKGVGYCIACDAPLFEELNVAVIGHNKKAEHEIKFISDLAQNLYYIPMYDEEVNLDKKIQIIKDKPIEIQGDGLVNKLILKNTELEVDGVFIVKDSVSPERLVPGIEIKDGHIKVDKNMSTSIDGCFAAGDIVGKPYQYIKGAGEGAIAAYSVIEFLNK